MTLFGLKNIDKIASIQKHLINRSFGNAQQQQRSNHSIFFC